MKNFLNRLTRLMIIMLMLVDRTPFLNVYANNGNGNNDGGEVQVAVLTPTSLAVDVAKPDVGATVTKNTYWQISKTVDKPVLNLPIAGSDTVNYTVSVLQTSDITFNLTYEVTYTLTGTTPADFSVRASVKHPSGNELYSVAEIDSFVDVSNSTFKVTYTTQFTVNEATLALISPFKINIEIFAESDLATVGVTNQTPAINVKSPNVTNVDGTLTLTDPMDSLSPRIITVPGSYSYPYVISSTSLAPRTVTNTVTGTTVNHTYTSSASVLVNTYNRAPSAGDQNLTTFEEVALPIVLFGSDPDTSQTLSYHILTSPAGGTLSDNVGSPNLTYTPNLNYFGTTSFTYRVFDGIDYSAPGTIEISVTNVNDAPVATGDTIYVDEGDAVTESFIMSDVDDTVLTVHFVDLPDYGLVVDNGNGTYTYTHNGTDPVVDDYFTFYVKDPSGLQSATVRVDIEVNPINEAPVAVNDTAVTDEDVSIDIPFSTLLANDTDVDTLHENLTISNVGSAVNGTVSIVGSIVRFVPSPNYNGPASFEYTVSDGSLTDTATVTVTVNPVNDAPVAVNDSYNTDEDTALNIPAKGVLTNDTDVELNALTAILVSGPSNGSLTLNTDGSFTYTPNANFNGSDSFTYKANDGSADSNIATVAITVRAINDAPVADNDAYSINEDATLNVAAPGVLDGDTDQEGSPLTAILVSGPAHGSLTLNADGSFTYTPTANYNGPDSFTYKANDGTADSNVATVSITVNPVNDAPIANNDTYSTNEDVTLTVAAPGVTANDTDIDGPSLSVSYVLDSGPAKGSLTLYPDGSFTYVPAANDFGTYYFTYRLSDGSLSDTATVTINVISQEDDPIATPSSFSVNEGQQYTGSVTGVDGDGDVLTFYVDTDPAHGTLSLLSTGAFTYTHDGTETPNVDKFTFKVSDDGGLTFSAPADVNITILDVNDAPVAVDDSYTTAEDTQLVVPVLTGVLENDSDADSSITAVKLTNPSKGTVVLASDGSFTYTPNANANGSDSFTYQAFDGTLYSNIATVTINITEVNDKPLANPQTLSTAEDTALPIVLTGSDVETALVDLVFTVVDAPAHGSISGTGSSITYTPSLNYNGPDSFTFTVSDGSLTSDPATIAITVTEVNDAPVAVLDSYTTNEDTLLTVPSPGILGNDDDVDDDPLTITVVTNVANGALTLNQNGSFTYLPSANFNGTDSFTYKINDGTVDSNTVSVTITVNAIDDRPVADPQSLSTPEDTALNITLTGSDVETSSLLFGVATQPLHGTLSGTAPNLVYTPAPNYNGPDSFIFGLSDGFYRAYATITINVTPVNDRPVAEDDEVSTPEDTAILINFVASDVETASLIYGISEQPLNGVLSGSGSSRTYTPNANFTGTDTFVFGVSDGFFRAYGTITVNVTPVNDAPVAVSNLYTTDEDTALVEAAPGVLGNDTDVEGSPLTAVLVDGPDFATSFTLNSDGSFTYTPIANFSGLDIFTYKANDGELDSNVATVTINVNPIEDAPVAVDDPDDEEIDAIETPEDTPLVLDFDDLLANDYDVDDLTFGQMTLMISLRSFDFNTAFSPSVGSLTLDMTGRTVTFTPPLNYVGPATFQYTIIDEDDNVSEPATVFIEVTPVNDAPVASPLAFTIANAGSSTGQLVASDVDDTELVFSLLAAPTNGSATVSPAGIYTYTHNGTATLSDSFTFSVTDGELSATSTVTVTVLAAPTPPPVNLPPVANALAFTIANGAVSTGTLTGSDPEGAPISFAIATLPANGSLTISPAGIYVYDHNGTATTTDSFTFTVSDGSLTATATVSITILPIPAPGNTPPEVIDGVVSTPFGEVIEGSVAPLGSDADGDDLSFALVDDVTNGTLVFNPDGTYTYTPNEGFDGSDSFTFIANDGTDDSNTGTLTINVIEEEVIVEEPETPLAAPDNNWLWWLLALLAGLLLWLLAFLRPNMKYTLSDKANNQKIVRRRLAKPDDKTMIVELNDKDMVGLTTIEVEFFKRLAKHCGDVTVKFMLKGTQVHSVTIPANIDDVFTTIIHL